MDLLLLPVEVIPHIAENLSTNDLLSCSLVSIAWREEFNVNKVWIRRCKGGSRWQKQAEQLQSQACSVEPKFELPMCDENSLEPLCQWRVYYMIQVHLRRNWLHNRKRVYTEKGRKCEGVHCVFENIAVMYNEYPSFCDIWDIKDIPVCIDSIALQKVKPYIHVFDDFLAVLQINLLQVFKKENNKFKLFNVILLSENKVIPAENLTHNYFTKWYRNVGLGAFSEHWLYFTRNKFIFFEHIFITYDNRLSKDDFYIWNLKSCSILKVQNFRILMNDFNDLSNTTLTFHYYSYTSVFIMFATDAHDFQTFLVSYDVFKQNYTNFHILLSNLYLTIDTIQIFNDYIIYFDSNENRHKLLNIKDMVTRDIPLDNISKCIIENSKIILKSYDEYHAGRVLITVLDINTLERKTILYREYYIDKFISSNINMLLVKCPQIKSSDIEEGLDQGTYVLDKQIVEDVNFLFISDEFKETSNYTKLVTYQNCKIIVANFW